MYKLTKNSDSILRISDGALIPVCKENSDYMGYLMWLEWGNTPEPFITVDEEVQNLQAEMREWRNKELARADVQLLKVQDGATKLGTQKAWREYRNALRDWPDTVNFPNTKPTAPDAD